MSHPANGQMPFDPLDMAPTHGRHMLNVQREQGNDLMHWYFRDGSQIDADARQATVQVHAKGVSRSFAEQCARDIKSLAKYPGQDQVEVKFLDGSHWLIEFEAKSGA